MPTYHYRCDTCGKETNLKMTFGSTDKPPCETCKTPMTKFIVPPTVHFKGSGFYKTDGVKKTESTVAPKKPEEPKPVAAATPPSTPAA